MKFNKAVKILLNEEVQSLNEFARIADHEQLQGMVTADYDKAAVTAAINEYFKIKPKGFFSKAINGKKDLDIGNIFIKSIDEVIEKMDLDSSYGLRAAMFDFHGHNNNVDKNILAQEVWKNINEELGTNIPKTKIKSTLLQVKGFMKANSSLFLTDEEAQVNGRGVSKGTKGSAKPATDSKNYKVIKDTSETEIQEAVTDQFDRRVARAVKLLGQGEVLSIAEIKSFFDTFDYDTMTIVKFLVDMGIIEPSDEVVHSPEENETEGEDEVDGKEVKDLDQSFFADKGIKKFSSVDSVRSEIGDTIGRTGFRGSPEGYGDY